MMDQTRHGAGMLDERGVAWLGLAVFALSAAATAIVGVARPGPPWIPLALLAIGGLAALVLVTSGLAAGWFSRRRQRAKRSPARFRRGPDWLERLQVDAKDGRRVVRAREIEWIEGAGNYARLHLDRESFLYRASLRRLSETLEPSSFARIHKSAIVNLDAIHRIDPLSAGDAYLHLRSGSRVRMSRRYAESFHRRTGRAH